MVLSDSPPARSRHFPADSPVTTSPPATIWWAFLFQAGLSNLSLYFVQYRFCLYITLIQILKTLSYRLIKSCVFVSDCWLSFVLYDGSHRRIWIKLRKRLDPKQVLSFSFFFFLFASGSSIHFFLFSYVVIFRLVSALNPDKWLEFKLQDTATVSHNTKLFRFLLYLLIYFRKYTHWQIIVGLGRGGMDN